MDTKFNGVTVETNGVRSIAGGGTGATNATEARTALGLGSAATADASAYATAAQGAKADSALQRLTSDTTPVAVIRCITQAEYDAIGTYDPSTLYFIK